MQCSKSKKDDLYNAVQVRTPKDYPWVVLGHMADDLRCSFSEEEYLQLKSVVRKRDLTAYNALSEAWGPQSSIPCDISADKFFAKYQASSLLKKFQFSTDRKLRLNAAKEKFLAAEAACATFNLESSKELAYLQDNDELSVYTYARQFLSQVLGEELPSRSTLTHWSRHGPGANLDTLDGRVSLYDKYSNWPYSCTEQALGEARLCIQADERWLGALEDDYRRKNGIEPWRLLNQDVFWSSVFKVVPGNRITFVPKNSRTDRSIAIEPCMNLYLQLGIDGFIRRRLKRWGVDLDDQRKNQELARKGSLNWDDPESFVTLDLAAASDSISTSVCQLLLPPQWYRHLMLLRSPVGELGGETIEFQKISSMGNGFTFALESAIFASIVYGAQKTLKGSFDKDASAVYGDDIIVTRDISELVVRMLNRCGFQLNPEKSFVSGPFRESCGADWLRGILVRPVFLTSNPVTVMELFCDLNRLRRILSLRYMGLEYKVCDLIVGWIPPSLKDYVGPLSDEDFASYIHVPAPVTRYRNGMWKFKRLIVIPKRLKGDNFLFRKLMHSLMDSANVDRYQMSTWGGLRMTSTGSRFTVTKRGSVMVSHTSSPASYWQDEYSDSVTVKP